MYLIFSACPGKPVNLARNVSKMKITELSELPTSGSDFMVSGDASPQIDFSGSPEVIYGLGGYLEPLLPLIMSLMQDPAPKTRLLALNCSQVFAKNPLAHQPPHFTTIISQVLKRYNTHAWPWCDLSMVFLVIRR